MNILPVQNFNFQYSFSKPTQKSANTQIVQQSSLQNNPVFGMAPSTVGDLYIHQLKKPEHIKRMARLSATYLDMLESVANKLKNKEVFFNRVYCERNPIKSPESCKSKIMRSGTFKVPDQIRATLFCSNLSDLSILNDYILPAFKERGFVVAMTSVPIEEAMKRGYKPKKQDIERGTVNIPDIDIRVENIDNQISKLSPEYRTAIGHPQKSGYEDIQIRFVRDYDKKENPVTYELIIVYGENYAKAKHYESEKIYNYVRKLNTLSFVNNIKNEKELSLTKRCIEHIQNMLHSEISKKLFDCAKDEDVYAISKNMKINNDVIINLSERDITSLKVYFNNLKTLLNNYYDNAEAHTKSNKRIANLRRERANDLQIITSVQDNIMESVEFFNQTGKFSNLPLLEDLNV